MFSKHIVAPTEFALRFVELLPEYLPGLDTGAFEPTDIRRCWNKTLKTVLTVIGKEDNGLSVAVQNPMMTLLKDQSSLTWQRDGAPVFAMTTGWGNRAYNWETQAGIQQELRPGVSVNVSYDRRWFGNR